MLMPSGFAGESLVRPFTPSVAPVAYPESGHSFRSPCAPKMAAAGNQPISGESSDEVTNSWRVRKLECKAHLRSAGRTRSALLANYCFLSGPPDGDHRLGSADPGGPSTGCVGSHGEHASLVSLSFDRSHTFRRAPTWLSAPAQCGRADRRIPQPHQLVIQERHRNRAAGHFK